MVAGGKLEMIGQENERAVVGCVVKFDAAQFGGILVAGIDSRRAHGLVAAHAGGEVDGTRVKPRQFQASFGPDDKERTGLRDAIETGEIEVTAIHDIKCAPFKNELVEQFTS